MARMVAPHRGVVLAVLLLAPGCPTASTGPDTPELAIAPPIAKRVPHRLEAHGDVRIDDYYWLRDRDDPEVIDYLEAENAYTEAMTAHTARLRADLEAEMAGRLRQDDRDVPFRLQDYYYYSRWETGGDYPIYARKRDSLDAPEEVMLDVGALAQGHEFFSVGAVAVSEGQQLLAYSVDTVGRRIYTIRFLDLASGEALDDEIPDVTGGVTWANDDRTVFYTRQDLETLRDYQVYRHVLGTDVAEDVLVYEETDETFDVWVGKTKSRQYVLIGASQTLSEEVRVIPADDPTAEPRVLQPRERDHEYFVEHFGEHFYVLTNDEAENFRIMRAPVDAPGKANWEEVVGHRSDVLLDDFEIFADFLVLEERVRGLTNLRVRPWSGEGEHSIAFDEAAYVTYTSVNPEFDTATLRFSYSSMATPWSVFDYDMRTRERTLLKRDEVLGGYDPNDYATEWIAATARDGTAVPISLIRRKDTPVDGTAPVLLYAYGSYGSSTEPSFSATDLSLVDRGFVSANAHVRGGDELGRQWYEHGKLLEKRNTFTDFIDCAEFLIAEGYADPERVYAYGGSAGGLLVGAVVNMRPDLFDGAIAGVPFVDVVTTMLDPSIPLTTAEYDEWGNPNDPEYYEYMLSYSPYDNVEAKDYPALLVTTGLHDSQVQYWEPAKWVAKLRALKTDHNPLLLRTDMSSGHGGKSGRLRRYEASAFKYAFLLDLAGIRE